MGLLKLCFAAVLLVSASGLRFQQDYDHLRRSAIRIQAVTSKFDFMMPFQRQEDAVSVGSGFVVETSPEPLFVTNAHVVSDAHTVSLQMLIYGEQQFEAEVVSVCSKFDLALVVLREPKKFLSALATKKLAPEILPLSDKVANMGEDVVALGFPLGQSNLKISNGVIAGNEEVDANICLQSTAPISPGSSGGPLLDAEGKEVVGVNFAKATTGENINYVIPAWRVKQMVALHHHAEEASKREASAHSGMVLPDSRRVQVRFPSYGLTTIEANEALYKMSNGCNSGLYVGRVAGRSFLRQADPPLEAGSFLTSVNGVAIDKFGQGLNERYCRDQVSYKDLFVMVDSMYGNVTFETCKDGKTETHEASLAFRAEYDRGLRYVEEPALEDIEFEMFGGVGVMEMTVNHISAIVSATGDPGPARWLHPDLVQEPRLVVNYVAPGTYGADFLTPGAAVDKVNGKKVRTLKEFRNAFVPEKAKSSKNATKTGFLQGAKAEDDDSVWTLETDLGKVYATMFKETLISQLDQAKMGATWLFSKSVQGAAEKMGMKEANDALARALPRAAGKGKNSQVRVLGDVTPHHALLSSSTMAGDDSQGAGKSEVVVNAVGPLQVVRGAKGAASTGAQKDWQISLDI